MAVLQHVEKQHDHLPGWPLTAALPIALTCRGTLRIVEPMDAPQTVEAVISLTPRAIEAVKNIRVKDGLGTQSLRVAVVGGGCSGFSYQLDYGFA